jgi:hypothetical protein
MNDIGNSLETLQEYDIETHCPSSNISTSTDNDTKDAENRQYEIKFKAEFDACMKRK